MSNDAVVWTIWNGIQKQVKETKQKDPPRLQIMRLNILRRLNEKTIDGI